MRNAISCPDLVTELRGQAELCILDVREVSAFGRGHLLGAAHMPLSRLAITAPSAIPWRNVPIVVCDDDGNLSIEATDILSALGFSNSRDLDGGCTAWRTHGLALFPEIEVPAKVFGAFARTHGQPPFITAVELKSAQASGADLVVLDARPRSEYQIGNIPGSIAAPAGELLRCYEDLVINPATHVVVNCMSATRGTLGGLSLIAAGVPNPVSVLHHGTRGWLLAGYELEHGATRIAHAPSTSALRAAATRTSKLLNSAQIQTIDSKTLRKWQYEEDRTTYLIDVRTQEEYANAHIAGALHAGEGAAIMQALEFAPTLRSRLVVADDDGIRASVAALWLAQMGMWEVVVLRNGLVDMPLVSGVEHAAFAPPKDNIILATKVAELQAQGNARIVDVGSSQEYARAHIPGACWCSSVEISQYLLNATFASVTVITAADAGVAHAAGQMCAGAAYVLEDGNAAWTEAGFELTNQHSEYVSEITDHWLASSERPGDQRQNVESYLNWETGLYDEVQASGWNPYTNLLWRD